MTVNVTRFHDTSYIKPAKRTFYPVKIPIKHHQLRHYISVAEEGVIYYVSETEVWALHTKLRLRERIASLAFAPQCLGSAFGWICVGGMGGKCAFIDITEAPPFTSGDAASGEIDGLLPLNLDPQPRDPSEPVDTTSQTQRSAWLRAKVQLRQVGTEIVNSITMYKMKSPFEGVTDEELAVISSNDKTVQIFSLRELRTVCTLHFPVPMNHATISPDGNTLVACGDDMGAFFVRRMDISDRATGSSLFDKYEWAPQFSCQLTGTVRQDHCFSTAFSPSGHICTIASQFGVVTVFDMEKVWVDMEDREAVIDCFTSSRPAAFHDESRFIEMPGAIRSTAFSPNPWDLFAWAEDQGRVCVTDLRDGFRSRQLIQLDIKVEDMDDLDIVEVADTVPADLRELQAEAAHLRRQRLAEDEQDTAASVQGAAEYIVYAAARRRRLHEAAGSDNSPHELTETERQILETLRVERLREETPLQRFQEELFRMERLRDNSDPEVRNSTTSPLSVNYGNSSQLPTSNTSIRQYLRDRNQERNSSATSSRAYNPRRQSSIVISNSGNPNPPTSGPSPSPHPSSLAPLTGDSTLSASPSRLATSTVSPSVASEHSGARQTSTQTTPSLIPTPTPSDPWAAVRAPASSSTQQSVPNIAHLSAPSTLENLPTLLPSNDSNSLDDPSPATRWPTLEPLRDRNGPGRSLLSRDRQRGSGYQHPELEQARAQLRLTVAAEADTEDVLRHMRWRVAGDRSRLRESESASGDGTNEGNSGNDFFGSGASNREREQRLDAVRMAQVRRLQERAVVAAGMDREHAFMSSLIGNERDHGSAVMGMGWGSGGRELFVATEDGIFRFEINLDLRKQFPAVKTR